MMLSERISCLENEREANYVVQRLVLCGVRPSAIRHLVSDLRTNDIKRIHKFVSPKKKDERHGRNIKSENIGKLDPGINLLYLKCIDLVNETVEHNKSSIADAISAVWRIFADNYGFAHHESINGATCEEMLHTYLQYKYGELSISNCGCGNQYISHAEVKCPQCRIRRKDTGT